ncbi:MAG: transposase, partial [Holosporaceae bacterium]|jgi:transposase|nr:transposase [Holosporaceae bacterium]
MIFESIRKHIEYLKNEIKILEEEMEKIIEANAREETEVLQSENGVGFQTSAILLGLLPELGILDNRQISQLVGLAPMARDSGKMSGKRSIRGGRERVRRALFMASISAIKNNPKVKEFYKRLRNDGKNVFVALTAVAHKLLIILNLKMRLFREGKDYF